MVYKYDNNTVYTINIENKKNHSVFKPVDESQSVIRLPMRKSMATPPGLEDGWRPKIQNVTNLKLIHFFRRLAWFSVMEGRYWQN